MTIAWTPELRARLYPSRTIANPGYRDELLAAVDLKHPIDADVARAEAAKYWKSEKTDVARAKEGLAKNPEHWRPAVEAMLARCKKPALDRPLDVDVEAATVALEVCPLFMALPYWIAAGGIPFALRALIRCHEVVSYAWVYGYSNTRTWIVESRDYSYDRPKDNGSAWELMRTMLADAIEPIYDEAHGIADQARLRTAGGTPNQSALQLMLPFAFPDEKAWAAAGGPSAIGLAMQRKRASTGGLARYVSVAPVETAVELLTCTVNDAVHPDDLLTALAHHGASGGARIYEAALETAPNHDKRRAISEDLLAVRTGEVTKLLARLGRRDSKRGGTVFASFAARHRALMASKPAKKTAKRR